MTAKELAALLNGREYGKEITKEEEAAAKESGLVVVFGASDDLMEFRGAIDDEVGCWGGGTVYINENGMVSEQLDECSSCKLFLRNRDTCPSITAIWHKKYYPWEYQTDIPHETFEIFEDGEKYCQGIVFSLAELKAPEKYSAEECEQMFRVLRDLVRDGIKPLTPMLRGSRDRLLEFITDLQEATNHAG